MTEHKSKRHSVNYNDDDIITDTVFGEGDTEYVVSLKGSDWRNYDWVMDNFSGSAKRMADWTHFVYLNHKDDCTHSMVIAHSAENFRAIKEKRQSVDTDPIDPKFGTAGSA